MRASLNPLSSRKTIVRPSFLAFFLTPAGVAASTAGSSPRPAPALAPWPLTTPAHLPQDPPHVSGMVLNPTFLLDQMGHPVGRPQVGFVPQPFRPPLQPALNPLDVFRAQTRAATSTARLAQSPLALFSQLGCPLADRLPMHPYLASHFRLTHPLAQQRGRLYAPLLQSFEISTFSRWESHAPHHR